MSTHEDYFKQIESDLSKGVDKIFSENPAPDAVEIKTSKQRVLEKFRRLAIQLLEEGTIPPSITFYELPAFLEDEIKKNN